MFLAPLLNWLAIVHPVPCTFRVEPYWTVDKLKELIHRKHGIEKSRQDLLFQSRSLGDSATLKAAGAAGVAVAF